MKFYKTESFKVNYGHPMDYKAVSQQMTKYLKYLGATNQDITPLTDVLEQFKQTSEQNPEVEQLSVLNNINNVFNDVKNKVKSKQNSQTPHETENKPKQENHSDISQQSKARIRLFDRFKKK